MFQNSLNNAQSNVAGQNEEELSIRDCITSLMMNMRPWTQGDLNTALRHHSQFAQIAETLRKLEAEGVIVFAGKVGFVRSYVLVRENLVRDREPSKAIWRVKEENLKGLDPKGKIDLKEGLDVCIWKAMCDGKYRTPDEVAAIIAEFGNANRATIKARMMTLCMNKTWFDRNNNRGSVVTYALKKGRQMPGIEKAETEAPQVAEKAIGFSTQDLPQALADLGATKGSVSLADLVKYAQSKPVVTEETIEEKAVIQEKQKFVQLPIEESDTVRLRIWKVMSDRAEYRSSDLVTLLADYGSQQQTIYATMTACNHEGWFERRNVAPDEPGVAARYVYRLKDDVPMPQEGRARPRLRAVSKTAEAPNPIAEQTIPVVENQEQKEDNNMVADAQANQPKVANLLIEETVRIKGIDFTKDMIGRLVSQIFRMERSYVPMPHDLIKVETKYSINDVDFTEEELVTIYEHFKNKQ